MKVQSGVLATALALAVVSGACTVASSNPSGTGGTSSSGTAGGAAGSSGSGTGGGSGGTGICSNGSACGGSVIGTWTVASSCLSLGSANLDITNAGLDPRSCNNVTLSGTLDVTGTWTANADGTYVDGTTTTGSAHIVLPAGCLMISGTTTTCARVGSPLSGLGFSDVTCTDAAGGGCDCTATVQQSGTPGVMSVNASASGNYTASGNMVTLDGAIQYASCVSGNMMTWTPQTTSPVTSGSVVFQKSGTTGTAGTTGSAGRGGTSGTAGTTGSAGRGGTTGTAGTSGTAGTTGSAGRGGTTGTAGTTGSAGTTGTGGGTVASGPCDIYASAGTACGAAYSTIRTLRKAYTGPLYQVRNGSSAMNTGSGGVTKDIGQTSDGFADTATQDSFCNGSTCTLSILYDQSGNGNDLKAAPAGLSNGGTYAAMPDFESSATKGMLTVNGHKVYAIYMNAREGYRTPLNFMAKGVPLGNKDQGIYELADGTHSGTACCWDFGSVSPDPTKYVTMNTIFFGTGFWDKGAGSGPWFMGDFEGGVWAGGSSSTTGNTNSMNPSLKVQFALGVLHTPVGKYALRMADIKTATDLTTAYDGAIPSGKTWGNAGGLVLGVGGDNSNNSWGTFYEGAVTNGAPSNATDLAVMQNIQAAGYGK